MAYYNQGHFVKKKMRGERPRVMVRQHCQHESCKTGGREGVLQSKEDNGLKQRTNVCYGGKQPKC